MRNWVWVPAVIAAITIGTAVVRSAAVAKENTTKEVEPAAPGPVDATRQITPVRSTIPVKLQEVVDSSREWCQTEIRWRDKVGVHGAGARACPTEGTCDTPSVRDSWIPDGSTPIVTLRIKFNVFCNTNGSNCAATQAGADAQLAQLNSDYLPSRIQWTATTEFINDSTYRSFSDSEESAMKSAYADSPATQLNVYVVDILAGYLGVGTFAWDPDATGTQGGIIIDDNWFGAGQKTLTHESGHNVGLWHTHHGVSEVSQCSACWERADGVNGDTTGDFASDTAPTPVHYYCSDPGGTDPCSATPWGNTDPQNYMSYAPDSCYSEYSLQQDGRTHCWINDTLSGWSGDPTGGCCVGQSCSIETEADCLAMSGTYLGDATDCSSGSAGNPTVYQASPNTSIPDGGGPGNPATHTINVPDSFTVGDVDVDLVITHTWVGDLIVTVSHLGTSVTVVDRPGYSGSGYGCSANNFDIILDDEGTGGAIESQCVNDLSSPPNYTPNGALSAFDGMDAAGDWVITVSDNASADTGTLNTWSVHIDAPGQDPCVSGCGSDPECDDGLWCNGAETCVGGTCQSGTAPNCDDGVGCTDDSCNEATDSCDNVANDANCDDGQYCNGAETCDSINDCQAGTAVNCNDGVGCTDDSCNEATDSCDNVANDANCDDALYCNGAETCDAVNDCQAGTAVNCNDGVGCTDDSCNEATDSCDNIANDANCDNGLFCDGAETCNAVSDCQAGSDPCPGQLCDEVGDACYDCQNDGDCDDGVFCNGSETCVGGSCQSGTAVNCDDGVGCTDDSCNEATDSCDNNANDGNCDDGLYCNGAETCDSVSDCQAGTAVNCNDGVGCTDDSCNEATDSCDNIANDANCDDGQYCNGAETCDSVNDCQAGTAVNCDDGVGCTDDSCNEGTDSCDNVANDANCPDDGLFCNGTESCDAVSDCVSSGDPCSAGETCNETTDTCDLAPTGEGFILSRNADFSTDDRSFFRNETLYMLVWTDQVDYNDIKKAEWELRDAAKNKVRQPLTNHFDITYTASFALSGLPSTATDWTWKGKVEDNSRVRYNPTTTITVLDAPQCSTDPDCDDGLFCNGTETCVGGTCQAGTPVNCDDGVFCNGPETCDDATGCQAGTPVNCDDGVACTDDSCNEGTDSCDNVANDANCDNGAFCDGAETCDSVNDCQAGSDPCPGQTCDEVNDVCIGCQSDAECDDGLYCNGGETCVGGTCQAGTPENCDDGQYCNGTETCDDALGCQSGSPVNCDDGVGCTDDSCNETTDSCDNVANDAYCPDDGLFCNGTESCDAVSDCVSSGDPCAGNETCNEATDTCDPATTGEGFILSRNPDFSTDDRSFFRNETLYMLVWTDQVDENDIKKAEWELKDVDKNKVKQPLTNHFDGTYTASFSLSGLPSSATDWTWKGKVEDNSRTKYNPTTTITVSP